MDLMGFLTKTGLAVIGVVTFFLLLWTSADNQLYSASLSWAVLSKSLKGQVAREPLVILGAVLTVMLAFIKLHVFAVQWLSLLTAISLPAGVIIWTHFYIIGRGKLPNLVNINAKAFAAWILGSLAYILTYGNIYSVLLELAVTSLAYIALNARDLLKNRECCDPLLGASSY